MASIPIKYLPDGTKLLHYLIAPGIKEGDCYDAWKFIANHCANESYQTKGIEFDESYIPLAYAESFRIKISIAPIHRLTVSILDVSNYYQKKRFQLMK